MINSYQAAVDRELISCELGATGANDGDTVAGEKLSQVIDWHVSVATDPKVNGGYQLVHKDALVVTDNTQVIAELQKQISRLEDRIYELHKIIDDVTMARRRMEYQAEIANDMLNQALSERDAAHARGDYWQGVAQGDIPEDS